jgi:hypothetical protein
MSTAPRTLAEDLRRRSPADLRVLLTNRPDLLTPVPASLGALAVRVTSAPSVHRALDRCDRLTLQILEVCAALPDPTPHEEVLAALGRAAEGAGAHEPGDRTDALRARLRHCWHLGLVWGDPSAWHLVRTVRETFGPAPCGLAQPFAATRPLVRAYVSDPARLDAVLADAPDDARAALDRLVWGPPVGRMPDAGRPVSIESARTPLEWLLARDLLVATGTDTVTVPREVALHLRGGRLLRDLETPPAALRRTPTTASPVHAVHAALDTASAVLEDWVAEGIPALRSGGIGVRDTAALARALNCEPVEAAWWIEVLHAAGLIGLDDEGVTWLPTAEVDVWLAEERGARWVDLVTAWLDMPRAVDPARALAADATDLRIAGLRRDVLTVLGESEGAVAVDDLIAAFDFRFARGARPERTAAIRSVLADAERLGVCAGGAMTSAGHRVIAGDAAGAIDALDLPGEVDRVLLQADGTAIAPGPLTPQTRRALRLLGDIESTGGATVFRLSARSLARAFDAGYDTDGVLDLVRSHAATKLPQALEVLIADVGRARTSVRVGVAHSYAHTADPTVIAAALADRRGRTLGLRALGPTALASTASPEVLARYLGELGLSPVVESPDGTVLTARPPQRRAPRVRRVTSEAVDVDVVIRALTGGGGGPAGPSDSRGRGGSRERTAAESYAPIAGSDAEELPRTGSARVLALLREAVAARTAVRIGYSDEAGEPRIHSVEPIRVTAGKVTAYDHGDDTVRTFVIARITGVAPR